jgi:hypothetical protein
MNPFDFLGSLITTHSFFGPLITTAAALVAIRGGTWDKTKNGARKITGTGWLAVCVVCFGFIVSWFSAVGQENDKVQLNAAMRAVQSELDQQIEVNLLTSLAAKGDVKGVSVGFFPERDAKEAPDTMSFLFGATLDAVDRVTSRHPDFQGRPICFGKADGDSTRRNLENRRV